MVDWHGAAALDVHDRVKRFPALKVDPTALLANHDEKKSRRVRAPIHRYLPLPMRE